MSKLFWEQQRKIRIKDGLEEAERLSKEELKEYYAEHYAENIHGEKPSVIFPYVIAVASIFLIIMMALTYPGSEHENYRTMAEFVCEQNEEHYEDYILDKQYVIVECTETDYMKYR